MNMYNWYVQVKQVKIKLKTYSKIKLKTNSQYNISKLKTDNTDKIKLQTYNTDP